MTVNERILYNEVVVLLCQHDESVHSNGDMDGSFISDLQFHLIPNLKECISNIKQERGETSSW
jgi:hypothetical protein